MKCWFWSLTSILAFHFSIVVAVPAIRTLIDSFSPFRQSFYPSQQVLQVQDLALPTGTCNAHTPCPITACCGTNGLCGYSPSECGKGNCTSKCDSKAECGQYGVHGRQNCPLNVCCSKFGYVSRCRETHKLLPTTEVVAF